MSGTQAIGFLKMFCEGAKYSSNIPTRPSSNILNSLEIMSEDSFRPTLKVSVHQLLPSNILWVEAIAPSADVLALRLTEVLMT